MEMGGPLITLVITLDNMWSNCKKMNAPLRLIAAKKSRGLSHGETLLQLIVDVGPGRVLDHLGPRCFNHQPSTSTQVLTEAEVCLDAISALVW